MKFKIIVVKCCGLPEKKGWQCFIYSMSWGAMFNYQLNNCVVCFIIENCYLTNDNGYSWCLAINVLG